MGDMGLASSRLLGGREWEAAGHVAVQVATRLEQGVPAVTCCKHPPCHASTELQSPLTHPQSNYSPTHPPTHLTGAGDGLLRGLSPAAAARAHPEGAGGQEQGRRAAVLSGACRAAQRNAAGAARPLLFAAAAR